MHYRSLFGQRLLLVDAHVKVHWLNSQKHPALDLPWQHLKHGARQWHMDIEAFPCASDDWQ